MTHVFSTEQTGSRAIITIQKEALVDELVLKDLWEECKRLIDDQGVTNLLINFGRIRIISNYCIATLQRINGKMVALKRKWALCDVVPSVGEVFEITNLHTTWDVTRTQADVLASWE